MSIVLGNGLNNSTSTQEAQGMSSHAQRNHLEHIHNIDRLNLIECMNEKDEAGNIVIDTLDQPKELSTWEKALAEADRYSSRLKRADALWKRDLIPYSEVEKIVNLALFEIKGENGSWDEVDKYINDLEQQPKAQTVTFYAEMGIEAARRFSGVGGGWRLYVIAKSLDAKGLGMVKRDELESFMLELGVDQRSFYRWINEARRYDLVIDVQSVDGDWMLRLPNAGKAAASLGCQRISRKVTLPIMALIGKGWKARVNGAFMATFNGKPIARETIQKTYNIPQSTQRYRDAAARVTRITNIADLGEVENSRETIELLQAAKREGLYHGEYVKGGNLYRRLPNIYQFTTAIRGGRGRARKANKIIKLQQQQNGLLQKQQALSDDVAPDFVRLYNMTEAQTKRTVKRIDEQNTKVQFVYELKDHTYKERNGIVLWNLVSVGAL